MDEKSSNELIDEFEKIIGEVIKFCRQIKFDGENIRNQYLLAHYCTLIELSPSILKLVKGDENIGVPILSRAFLEAYVETRNLLTDSIHHKTIELACERDWKKIIKEAKNKNIYLSAIGQIGNLKEILERFDLKIERLEKEGVKELNVFGKFKKAEMEKEYRSIYKMWSWHSHHSQNALLERHFIDENGSSTLQLFRELPKSKQVQYVLFVAESLIDATIKIHDYFDSSVKAEAQALRDSFEMKKKEWQSVEE